MGKCNYRLWRIYSYYKGEIEERKFAEILGVSEINYVSLDLFFCITTNSTKDSVIDDYKNALFQKKKYI